MGSTEQISMNSGEDINKLLQSYGYKESFKTWKSSARLHEAEDNVLRMLSFYPDGDSERTCEVLHVDIGGGDYMHEFCIENKLPMTRDTCKDIVLVHGYGTALGVFIRNFDELSQIPGVRLHAIDMLGYGLSSRPRFPRSGFWDYYVKGKVVTKEQVEEALAFFVDSLEAWREKRNVDSFVLVGHSLGGYLSSFYALRHPERIDKLVLVSPVGVETSIYDLTAEHTPEHQHAGQLGPEVASEFKEDATEHTTDLSIDSNSPQSSSLHIPNEKGFVEHVPNIPWLVKMLWNTNVSPFSLLRLLGPLGPKICANWSFRRFGACKDTNELMNFHQYAYNNFKAKGSGEYAMMKILAPGALARVPLLSQLPGALKCDSLWMYGSNDWMSKEAGCIIVEELQEKSDYRAEYKIVNNAGHHLYLDNPEEFNRELKLFLNV
ncbi:uncharacterized protein Ecym_5577 [Eremothecium cymbalariae DBVPG|uniref:AB hydrolase-1 domain-containing protein n=1 Tax=Eremothecium cymbalariae (strain CBS 270.75 / DBVPG 7215 / KCTC 17166 / NRRL Y-17582) TaxID=931890 RepID=I6NE23_ERECY|nr:hypothetical protein Ecym_5577 [Eremothecium cymbalariae DBVPG\